MFSPSALASTSSQYIHELTMSPLSQNHRCQQKKEDLESQDHMKIVLFPKNPMSFVLKLLKNIYLQIQLLYKQVGI